ncbi:MAG: glycoside hydrolase family 3 C-terminal domain-containing protein [Candidatus Heimdallarchaeum endolithica]|uniref:Glycoside hydrolase family 3 C-terminal domain-containing protein n=1 Tax=Candidatus Heimdallarchaeum endolithica TaxID=2876572 RepID=A0A9Y1FNW2_9ARCH|nr:MAG: glycoside hydrolase family 3 C-terminal domain-containing protein [Candidatus Heimdallarchaeum endolithica]
MNNLLKFVLHHIFTTPRDFSEKLNVDIKLNEEIRKQDFFSLETTEKKVEYLLSKLTINEKISLLSGEEMFAISGVDRFKLPRVWTTDASSGIRTYGKSTAFPVLLAMTASWNKDLILKVGEAIGEECLSKGISVLLGPGVNIYRVPTNGRNFEYMGEDPFLASELVVSYIQGLQKTGIIATVKHFVANNSEYKRHSTNVIVDERTLHEIYFPAFKAAVQKGKAKAVMSAYNLVNGVHCSENRELLTEVLRNKWKFDGIIISDWDSVYSTEGPLEAGLDIEMPEAKFYTTKRILNYLQKKHKDNNASSFIEIDSKVRNILKVFFAMGIYGRKKEKRNFKSILKINNDIALEIARESIVLLKNDGNCLPINMMKKQNIAVLGRNAFKTPTSGGGSCYVHVSNPKSIFEALVELAPNINFIPIKTSKDKIANKYQQQIKTADKVIICTGFTEWEESETFDRPWEFVQNQSKLINKVAELNKKIIVVVNAGGGFETESWINSAEAIIHSFYLGQNAAIPVAEVILGKVNPSGKLPFTMAKRWNDFSTVANYSKDFLNQKIKHLKQNTKEKKRFFVSTTMRYKEGIMIGYRHFDTHEIEPQFPFGHGLSYTSFNCEKLTLNKKTFKGNETIEVKFKVKNTGNREGKVVVQAYIRDIDSSLIRPFKELKGFVKITLRSREEKEIQFNFNKEHLQYYDPQLHQWKVEEGTFELLIGFSSRDIRVSERFEYKE